MLDTTPFSGVTSENLEKYFGNLVNKIFKILPILENDESSIKKYLEGLHIELEGCQELIYILQDDPLFISLLSTLTWLTNHVNEECCPFQTARREVFNAISICKNLEKQISAMHNSNGGDA